MLAGTAVLGGAVLVPSSVHAAQTVQAPTNCITAQTHGGPGARQGVTFVAPPKSDVLAAINIAVRNTGPSAGPNRFRVEIQEWDPTADEVTGPILAESGFVAAQGFDAAGAWTSSVGIGPVPVIPGRTYVAHIPSDGDGAIPLALCLAGAALPGSELVAFDLSGGWSASPFLVPAGFSATFLLRPSVTSVTPEALPGETIAIMGTGFDPVLTTGVTIDGIAASFTVVSATELTAIVPSAASAGLVPVQVTSDTLLSDVTPASQVRVLTPPAPPAPPALPTPPVIPPPAPLPPPTVPEPPVVPMPEQPVPAMELEPAASGSDRVEASVLAPTGADPLLAVVAALAGVVATASGALLWFARRARLSGSMT